MSIIDPVKGWIFGIALSKGVKSLAKLIVSYCMAKGISVITVVAGIPFNSQDVLIVTAAINSALKELFVWAKAKYPNLSWLP